MQDLGGEAVQSHYMCNSVTPSSTFPEILRTRSSLVIIISGICGLKNIHNNKKQM